MPFERHTETRKSFSPKVSLAPSGLVGFSEAAVNKFGLKEYQYAVLYYNREDDLVGIELTNDEEEPGVLRMRNREQGSYLAAKSFIGNFEIQLPGTMSYDLTRDGDMLVFDLKKGRQRNATARDNAVEED